MDIEENEKEICCIAAPIRDYSGEVIAALSISSPFYRINTNQQKDLKNSLLQVSKKISKRLGYNEKTQKEKRRR